MKKFFYSLLICLLLIFLLVPEAWSTTVINRRITTFRNTRSVIFVVGGHLLIIFSLAAIWKRKLWHVVKWIFVFLVVVGTAGRTIDYVTRYAPSPDDICYRRYHIYHDTFADTLSEGYSGVSQSVDETSKISEDQKKLYLDDCVKEEKEKLKKETIGEIINYCVFLLSFIYLIYLIVRLIFCLFRKILSKLKQKEKNS